MNKRLKKHLRAFTLVELIVVITILAILGTIAFLSLQWYQWQTRDSTRISTLAMIDKWLAVLDVKTGRYPYPEGTVSSWSVNGVTLAYVGEIREQIASIVGISKAPQDILSNNYYVYGTDVTNQYYQVATVLENTNAYTSPITPVYADTPYRAKVNGNYNWLLKVGGSLYNLPSLIFVGSGSLLSSNVYFVVNKLENLPYKIADVTNPTPKTTAEVLNVVTAGWTQTLTGIVAPTTMDEFTANSGALAALGYTLDQIGQTTLGTKYISTATGTASAWTCDFWDGVTTGTVLEDCTL